MTAAALITTQQKIKQWALPLIGWICFFIEEKLHIPYFFVVLIPMLFVCILQAVHHAEIIAEKVGEPFGAMILALAVTCIEVSLIVSMMLASGPEAGSAIARDTVFSAIMIILNGMVGISIFAGGIRFKEQIFIKEGVYAALITLVSISVLVLILPNFTTTVSGPYFSTKQLLFVAAVTLVLYVSFIFIQSIRHKSYFLLETPESNTTAIEKPSNKTTGISVVLLFICLGAVIFLAEALAPDLDILIEKLHAPHALAGIIIATIVLLPEGLSAYKAAKKNDLQKSLNLSLGSALASIGLSIPIVAIFSYLFHIPLTLGISNVSITLFLLSLWIVLISFSTGKTTILPGIVLLVIFLTYLMLTIFP
jgi:Ca2+:H+ antiporter